MKSHAARSPLTTAMLGAQTTLVADSQRHVSGAVPPAPRSFPTAFSPLVRLRRRSPKRRCLFSSWLVAGLSPDSMDSTPMLVVRNAPVVACACWLTNSCSSLALATVPRVSSPFHHSSAPNMATDWMQAVMTFVQFAGERPSCPASRRSRVRAFLPSFILLAWCSFSVSCESSQIPSHRVASLFNGTVLLPTVTAASESVFLPRLKIAASVLR